MSRFKSPMHKVSSGDDGQKRSRLLNAVCVLSEREQPDVLHRLALAEAEFRLAILPTSDLQESIDYLQKAIAHDPLHPKLFFHLGRCLYRSGDFRSAAKEYQRALKLAPGSHRIYVHLALALLELSKDEKKVGQTILDALVRGAEHELAGLLAQLDELAKKAQIASAGEREEDQPPKEEGASPVAARSRLRARESDNVKYPVVESRWKGVWRLALVSQLSAVKPNQKQIGKLVEKGKEPVANGQSVAEYAVACLFLLLGGEGPEAISKMLEKLLENRAEDPAVQLVTSAVSLAQIQEPEPFVEKAVKELRERRLPLEVVCCLHQTKFGTGSTLPAIEALRALDYYPPYIRRESCFRELRLAILDDCARKAWAEGQYDHARLLWRETIPLDPHRIAVAHNLALVAARTKSFEDYMLAWERVAELLYLHAAAAGDVVQVCLEERRAMHLAFAQQSRLRYCAPPQSPADKEPKEEEIRAWLGDRAALDTWLREWDLYYLNSRLRFHSPIHLLGIPRDASEEAVQEARDAFIRQIKLSLSNQTWAGIRTFCLLAEQAVNQAAERTAINIERLRDPYYAEEMAEADALAQEAIDRGLLLDLMIIVLVEKCPASYLQIGCAIARRLFALPWKILQPLCVRRGMISAEKDLVKIFENHFIGLLMNEADSPQTSSQISERLAALEEASKILPHQAVQFKMIRIQILVKAKRNAEAYTGALELLPLLPTIKDEDERNTMKTSIVNLIDNLAFSELPEKLLQPNSPGAAQETIRQGRSILGNYPRAAGFRSFLASLMIQLGAVDVQLIREANRLLEEGLPLAFNDEQRQRFEELLKEANNQKKTASEMHEIKTLIEGAIKMVNQAVERINREQTPQAVQDALQKIDQAIHDVERARVLARNAKLPEVEQQASEWLQKFQNVRRQLEQ